jgi:hypothetical protein
MIRTSEYCTGWMDSSIHRFLVDLESTPSSMKYALITCIDSSFDVVAVFRTSAALKPLATQSEAVGKGMLVSTARLLTAERGGQIFHGFDEIWFFPSQDVAAKPEQICITGPETLSPDPPAKLVKWMNRNKCSLGLGDGTGLNFIAKLRGVARHLVNELSATIDGNGRGVPTA